MRMGWDGMGCDEMGWDEMGWDGVISHRIVVSAASKPREGSREP